LYDYDIAYGEQRSEDREDDDGETGDDCAAGMLAFEWVVGVSRGTDQLQALKAETTGFMVAG
jgi:hypothetical protein